MNKDTRNGQCLPRQADRSDNTRRRIQSARCGGGRGVYGHIDGDFHYLHGDGRQSEDTVLTCSHYPRQEKGKVGKDLVALTWNACGMEQCAEPDIIDLLEAGEVYWDVVLLQEGPTKKEGSCTIIAGGHAFYVGKAGSSKRTTCVFLHRRWAIAKLSFYALNGRISYLDL